MKAIQMVSHDGHLFALADNGRVYRLSVTEDHWDVMPELDAPEPKITAEYLNRIRYA